MMKNFDAVFLKKILLNFSPGGGGRAPISWVLIYLYSNTLVLSVLKLPKKELSLKSQILDCHFMFNIFFRDYYKVTNYVWVREYLQLWPQPLRPRSDKHYNRRTCIPFLKKSNRLVKFQTSINHFLIQCLINGRISAFLQMQKKSFFYMIWDVSKSGLILGHKNEIQKAMLFYLNFHYYKHL